MPITFPLTTASIVPLEFDPADSPIFEFPVTSPSTIELVIFPLELYPASSPMYSFPVTFELSIFNPFIIPLLYPNNPILFSVLLFIYKFLIFFVFPSNVPLKYLLELPIGLNPFASSFVNSAFSVDSFVSSSFTSPKSFLSGFL